jgi:hypothetical protein
MGHMLQDIIETLRKKRYIARRDANLFGITLSRLGDNPTSPRRVALQVVERMFSHNVELLDEAIKSLEEADMLDGDTHTKQLRYLSSYTICAEEGLIREDSDC